MRFIKNHELIKNYLIPLVLLPIVAILLTIILKFTFNLGAYFGIFMRGLYELVIRNFWNNTHFLEKTYNILEKNVDFCWIFQINLI